MFVNRESELQTLQNEYNTPHSSLSVIYGRRRVGKTTLIREFIKDKPVIYYYATEVNFSMQLRSFTKDIMELLGLSNIAFESFEDALIFLAKNISEQKIILVMDEYQNFVKVESSFSSILQKVWDLHLKDSNIHLILCGSTISMMHSELLNYSAPLYGRSTAIIQLKPLLAKYIHDFVPHINQCEFMQIYASFGTIPKYLELYQKDRSCKENIQELILNKNSFLYNEGYFLLKQEINEVSTYFSILEAISKGTTKLANISSMLEMQSSRLTKYIEKLIALGFIARDTPITESNPLKSKLGRYRFRDNFLKFWFFYVYKNYRYLEIDLIDHVLQEIENNFNDNFVSFAYEDYIQECILHDPIKYLGFVPLKIGRWWNNKEEIDIVAYDETNIAFIECKYRNALVEKSTLERLKNKAKLIDMPQTQHFVLFSKSGFGKSLEGEDVRCFVV